MVAHLRFHHHCWVLAGTQLSSILLEELYGHLLLHICAFQGRAELLKTDHLVPVSVCLKDCALSDAVELIVTVHKGINMLGVSSTYSTPNEVEDSPLAPPLLSLPPLNQCSPQVPPPNTHTVISATPHLIFSPTIM